MMIIGSNPGYFLPPGRAPEARRTAKQVASGGQEVADQKTRTICIPEAPGTSHIPFDFVTSNTNFLVSSYHSGFIF